MPKRLRDTAYWHREGSLQTEEADRGPRGIIISLEVQSISEAVDWYSAFLHQTPDRLPGTDVYEFKLTENCLLQLSQGRSTTRTRVRLEVPDVVGWRQRHVSLGLDAGPLRTAAPGIVFYNLVDPIGTLLSPFQPGVRKPRRRRRPAPPGQAG